MKKQFDVYIKEERVQEGETVYRVSAKDIEEARKIAKNFCKNPDEKEMIFSHISATETTKKWNKKIKKINLSKEVKIKPFSPPKNASREDKRLQDLYRSLFFYGKEFTDLSLKEIAEHFGITEKQLLDLEKGKLWISIEEWEEAGEEIKVLKPSREK